MRRTIEAVIDRDGKLRLLEPMPPGASGRALVIIFDEPSVSDESAILSEEALKDWNRPEEDAAWSHLQAAR